MQQKPRVDTLGNTDRRRMLATAIEELDTSNPNYTELWRLHIHPVTMAHRAAGAKLTEKEVSLVLEMLAKAIKVFEHGIVTNNMDNRFTAYLHEWVGDLWRYRLHFSSNEEKEALQASQAFYTRAMSMRPELGRIPAELGLLAYKKRDYLQALAFFYRAIWSRRPAEESSKLLNDLLTKVRLPKKTCWLGALMWLLRKAHQRQEIDSIDIVTITFRQLFKPHEINLTALSIAICLVSSAAANPDYTGLVLRAMAEIAIICMEKYDNLLMAFLLVEFVQRETLSACLSLFPAGFWVSLVNYLNTHLTEMGSDFSPNHLATALRGFTLLEYSEQMAILDEDYQVSIASVGCDIDSMLFAFKAWACPIDGDKSLLADYILWDGKIQFHCLISTREHPKSETMCIDSASSLLPSGNEVASLDRALEDLKLHRDHLVSITPIKNRIESNDRFHSAASFDIVIFDSNIWLFKLEGIKETMQKFGEIQVLVPIIVLEELQTITSKCEDVKSVMAAKALKWLTTPHQHTPGQSCHKFSTSPGKARSSNHGNFARIRTVTSGGDIIPGVTNAASSGIPATLPDISNNDDILLRICIRQQDPVLLVTDDINVINKARVFKIQSQTWRDFAQTFL